MGNYKVHLVDSDDTFLSEVEHYFLSHEKIDIYVSSSLVDATIELTDGTKGVFVINLFIDSNHSMDFVKSIKIKIHAKL